AGEVRAARTHDARHVRAVHVVVHGVGVVVGEVVAVDDAVARPEPAAQVGERVVDAGVDDRDGAARAPDGGAVRVGALPHLRGPRGGDVRLAAEDPHGGRLRHPGDAGGGAQLVEVGRVDGSHDGGQEAGDRLGVLQLDALALDAGR